MKSFRYLQNTSLKIEDELPQCLKKEPIQVDSNFDGCFLSATKLEHSNSLDSDNIESKLRWSIQESFDFSKLVNA